MKKSPNNGHTGPPGSPGLFFSHQPIRVYAGAYLHIFILDQIMGPYDDAWKLSRMLFFFWCFGWSFSTSSITRYFWVTLGHIIIHFHYLHSAGFTACDEIAWEASQCPPRWERRGKEACSLNILRTGDLSQSKPKLLFVSYHGSDGKVHGRTGTRELVHRQINSQFRLQSSP